MWEPEYIVTGSPQNEGKGGGEDLFAALYADPARLEQFLKSMSGISLPSARALAERFEWRKYQTVVDVGAAQAGLVERPRLIGKQHAVGR